MTYRFEMMPDEFFWGGSVTEGKKNPFGADSDFAADYREECVNQVMPLFMSNKGRYIWSESPFKIEIRNGIITIDGEGVSLYSAGGTLKDAYLAAMKTHFPCDGRILPEKFFSSPQFNTWMEFVYEPTQDGVLKYAQSIIDNGFEPGVLIIDEGWQVQYGKWEFDEKKFPNPKEMMDKLHEMGFRVLLWVAPWVRADGFEFVMNTNKIIPGSHKNANKLFLRDAEGEIAMMRWWNGISAILDMRKECDRNFMEEQLSALMIKYGIDGFKFDGANICFGGYHICSLVNKTPHKNHNPHELNVAWNEFGRKYEYHEFKDTYKGGGKNSISRLCDCDHTWVGGADILVPNTIMQGILGHPFGCPDMVAGGAWIYSADKNFQVDEEMFIRMTQASVVCPMVQFSWAPWRALSEKSFKTVKKAVEIRKSLTPYMLRLVREAFASGEPIVRSLEYEFPHQGLHNIMDAFMLGDKYLVAPVVIKGAVLRTVKLPTGKWKYIDGTLYEGGQEVTVDAPTETLPIFEKIEK